MNEHECHEGGGGFVCPECGGRESHEAAEVETVFKESDPWSGVLGICRCARCGAVVPAHLAELWDGVSAEEARKEWVERYWATQPDWGEG